MTADNVRAWKSNRATSRDGGCGVAIAMFFSAGALGLVLALFYLMHPRFDLAVAEALYVAPHRFIGNESVLFHVLRNSFSAFFCIVCVLTVLGCVFSVKTARRWLTLSARQWLYLAVCVLVGPLTVANLGFKDHWGRPRPTNVVEFGGSKPFLPPLEESNACDRNCSFVSGEASSIYILCFAAAFLFPLTAGLWALAGIVFGTFAGFVRMAEGGHFLSDVLFAGVFMALAASGVHMLFIAISRGE